MDSILLSLAISIVGLINAYYLHFQYLRELQSGQKMFCLIGGDCGSVVGSKYGATFGIRNTLIGIVFYFILFLYFLLNIFGKELPQLLFLFKFTVSLAAFFSIYLFIIQTFILKKQCSWCYIAIFINLLIFFLNIGV